LANSGLTEREIRLGEYLDFLNQLIDRINEYQDHVAHSGHAEDYEWDYDETDFEDLDLDESSWEDSDSQPSTPSSENDNKTRSEWTTFDGLPTSLSEDEKKEVAITDEERASLETKFSQAEVAAVYEMRRRVYGSPNPWEEDLKGPQLEVIKLRLQTAQSSNRTRGKALIRKLLVLIPSFYTNTLLMPNIKSETKSASLYGLLASTNPEVISGALGLLDG
jgi:hypothetical protein